MFSFKRRTASKQPSLPAGTRISPGSGSAVIISTGIPSLDDILGGGLPLSCSLLILAPDAHSAYGELVQKYFIAQGLACGQKLCIVDDNAKDILAECMWIPGGAVSAASATADDEDEKMEEHGGKIKIAWRYEQMKQFLTTVPTSNQSAEDFCRIFDLTCRIPEAIIQSAVTSGQIIQMPVSVPDTAGSPFPRILTSLEETLERLAGASDGTNTIRICIPSLGSSQWDDSSPQELCHFLFSLRRLLRRYPTACASISMPPYMCAGSWGGAGWISRLGWLSDACISLAAFSADPSLSSMFSSHHGLVHIHSLPSPHTLLAPSDRFSTLRGLSSSGENNLAFKCMRKRLIFETLHLDLEGGVGERRTTPSASATVLDDIGTSSHGHPLSLSDNAAKATGQASIQVELEHAQASTAAMNITDAIQEETVEKTATTAKKAKAKKKVAFMSDRPDLYDF